MYKKLIFLVITTLLFFSLPLITVSQEEFNEGDSIAYKRDKWFYVPRSSPNNTIPSSAYLNAIQQKAAMGPGGYFINGSWQNIGPAPVNYGLWFPGSGRVNTVKYLNDYTFFIGAAEGGIWRNQYSSYNNYSWYNMSNGLTSLSSGALAIDKISITPIIYYGTGEGNYGFLYSYLGVGMFKSTDLGESWTQITNGFPTDLRFFRIVVRPGTGNNNQLLAATNKGLFRSTDFGETWSVINGTEDRNCNDVVFSEINNNKVLACGPNRDLPVYDIRGIGYMKSEDGGVNWVQLYPPPVNGVTFPVRRSHIDISKTSDNIVWAETNNGGILTALKSTDGGANFISAYSMQDNDVQGDYNMFVYIKPTNPDIVFFGGVDLFRTTNGGDVICSITGGSTPLCYPSPNVALHSDFHNLDFNPDTENHPNELVIACDGGIFISTNDGTDWYGMNDNQNFSITQVYRIASNNNGFLIGGLQDYGQFQKTNGNTWSLLSVGGDGTLVMHSIHDATKYWGITGNGGDIWKNCVNPIPNSNFGNKWDGGNDWIGTLAEHPTEAGKLFHARRNFEGEIKEIWFSRSTDYGVNWNPSFSTINSQFSPQNIEFSKTNPDFVYLSSSGYVGDLGNLTFGRELYKSTDGGAHWLNQSPIPLTSNVIPNRYITKVVTSKSNIPNTEDEVYITLSGLNSQGGSAGHVFKSTDGGYSWVNISGNLPDVPVNDIVFWNTNCTDKNLVIATDVGVFASANEGTTWQNFAADIPNTVIMDLELLPNDNKIRAATFGRGVWEVNIESSLYITSETEFAANIYFSNTDIIICSGGKLKLRDGQEILMSPGKKIIVNDGGEIELLNGSAAFICSGDRWNGIEIHDNAVWDVRAANIQASSTPITLTGNNMVSYNTINLSNLTFINAGPIEINGRSNVNVNNCMFNYDCGYYTELDYCAVISNGADNINIENSEVKTVESLWSSCLMNSTAVSVNFGSNISIQNNIITNIANGIFVSNSSPFIYNNLLSTTDELNSNIGIYLDNSYSATVKQNTINNCTNGIILFMSSPVLFQNEIINGSNGEYSLQNLYGSYSRLRPTFNDDEVIWDGGDNLLLSTNSGSSILFSCNPYPDINYGCNHIDAFDDYITSGIINCALWGDFYAYYNTWGTTPPDPNKFNMGTTPFCEPDGCFEPPPGGSHPVDNPPYHLIVNYGNNIYDTLNVISSTRGLPEDQDLYGTSIRNELTGNYTLAVTGFKQIIQNYQDSLTALNSLRHIMYCTDRMNYNPSIYSTLRSYYLALVQENQIDTNFVHVADELATKCLVRINQCSNAINEYEEVISESNDSLLILSAELNVIETYMIMQNNENAKSFTGKYAQLKPINIKDGFRMIREKLIKKQNVNTNKSIPASFSLSQNYPNPFNPITKINYALPNKSNVTIKVYDLLGRLVKTLVNETKEAGYYTVTFDGSGLASGVYFYTIEVRQAESLTGGFYDSKKMVLIK